MHAGQRDVLTLHNGVIVSRQKIHCHDITSPTIPRLYEVILANFQYRKRVSSLIIIYRYCDILFSSQAASMCEIAACNWEIITCVIVIGSLCAWDNQQGTATDKAANQCGTESTQLLPPITWVLHLGKLAYRLTCKLHCQHPSLPQ